jgi:pilus assembly protein CpaB
MAVSVLLEDPAKVGQFLRPGSRIAVFDTVKVPPAEGESEPVVQTLPLLDGIEVLAIGPTTQQQASTATDETWQATLVTVAVDQAQAEKLIHGIQAGVLYLALLGENTSLESSPGVNNINLVK